MKRRLIILLVLVYACETSDKTFCDCIEAGEELNNKTQKFFDKAPNKEENNEIQSLKKKKNALCAPYQEMDGDQLRTLQEACDEGG